MKICIPVKSDLGLQSKVSAHFGSAPMFLLVDSDTEDYKPILNANQHHEHGMCRPLAMLAGHDVDAVVVGGIGRGAFLGLSRGGISVLLSDKKTVGLTMQALKAGELVMVDESMVCSGHGHDHGPEPGGCGHQRPREDNGGRGRGPGPR